MKLQRINAYIHTFYGDTTVAEQYIEGGKYVEWTEGLHEAWDKQQEMEFIRIVNQVGTGYKTIECPRCRKYVYEEESNYCPNCGQKIKW